MLRLRTLDQIILWAAITLMVASCWLYIVNMASMMGNSTTAPHSGQQDWQLPYFWNMFSMWVIMMIAMMVPTAVRTLFIFSRIYQTRKGVFISPTLSFLGGYITVWTVFSLLVTLLQWQLSEASLLSPMMTSTSHILATILLIIAGLYQWFPAKDACLRHCQSPTAFISENFRQGRFGAFIMGLQHGGYCVGCCWSIMLLLFVTGVMNLLWILLLTLFVLAEKSLHLTWPHVAVYSTKASGIALIAIGLLFLIRL